MISQETTGQAALEEGVDGIGFTAVTNELGPDVIGIRLRFLHRKPLAVTLRGMRLV